MSDTTAVSPDASLAGGHNARKFDQGNDWKGETVDMSVVREACAANPGTEIQKRPMGNRPARHVLRINQELWYDFDVSEKASQKANKAAVKVYDEPGRGRRQCPKCSKYVGIKTATCVCGNTEWAAKAETPKVVPTYDTGGLGRKHCSGCNKYVGVRVCECACGHKFVKADPPTAPAPAARFAENAPVVQAGSIGMSGLGAFQALHGWEGNVCLAEAGAIAFHPESLDADGLREWASKMVAHGMRNGDKLYPPCALRHMIRSHNMGLTITQAENVVTTLNEAFSELGWPLNT